MDEYIFKRSKEHYKINLDPVKEYTRQAAMYLSKKHNIGINNAQKLVQKTLKETNIRNPIVHYNFRNEVGDMEKREDKLTDYVKDILDEGQVIVPSFTSYIHPSVKKSVHADFLAINIAKRKVDKHNAFKFKQLGDNDKSLHFNTMQKVRKIFNNSLSGAYASKSTILYNPSAHYTLTSITRSVASIGNSVTESVIAGNKQFKNPDVTLNYIVAVISNIRKNTIEFTLNKFHLHIPTPEEVMEMILYSTKWYWQDPDREKTILEFLKTLQGFELAAVMYVNDLWHLKKYNENFIKSMFLDISKKENTGSYDYLADLNNTPEGVTNLVHHICMDEIKGKNINYKELKELIDLEKTFLESDVYKNGEISNFRDYLIDIKHGIVYSNNKVDDKNFVKIYNDVDRPEKLLKTLASTAKHVTEALYKYKLLFRTFFTTDIMPTGISYIKDMMRDSIVLSDTDSTCGSYDKWVEWYFGEVKFSSEAVALSATAMTINTQVIDHNLKLFAKNMNIEQDSVELLKMKNEFFWPVFTATNVSKHYFADTLIQEGNVFSKPELELKGVHLIASAADQSVVKQIHNMLIEINNEITKGNKISLNKYLTFVANIERDIYKKIQAGDISVYRKDKIKEKGSYKESPTKSPYLNHIMWEDVFSKKYGSPGEPTYMTIKIPTIIKSKKKLREFVESIQDEEIKTKMQTFVTKYKREMMGTFRPPLTVVGGSGIPEEIVDFVDYKRIITDTLNAAYTGLEGVGAYRKPGRLFSEMGY